MYNTYFGFTKDPFAAHPAVEDLFMYRDFFNLAARLSAFAKERGIFLLTGEIGSGKTTALRAFAHSLNPSLYKVVYINTAFLNKKDIYSSLLRELLIEPPYFISNMRSVLKNYLRELSEIKKIHPIIILDEAQNLNAFILEELRLLTNFNYDSFYAFSLVIAGHKLLKSRISLLENEALNQRISIRFHLSGMTLEETCSFVRHSLEKVGSTSGLFNDKVLSSIHTASCGLPRKVNLICKNLLLASMATEKKIVDEFIFEKTRGEWVS